MEYKSIGPQGDLALLPGPGKKYLNLFCNGVKSVFAIIQQNSLILACNLTSFLKLTCYIKLDLHQYVTTP